MGDYTCSAKCKNGGAEYTAGDGIVIEDNTISVVGKQDTLTAGDGISISEENVISVLSGFTQYTKNNYADSIDGFIELSGFSIDTIMKFKKDAMFVVSWSDGSLHRSNTFIPKGTEIRNSAGLIIAGSKSSGYLLASLTYIDISSSSITDICYIPIFSTDSNGNISIIAGANLPSSLNKQSGSLTSANTGIWVFVRD